MAEDLKSKCHGSTVHESDGKTVCDVCEKECEVEAAGQTTGGGDQGTGQAAAEPKAGDVCQLPDNGGEGVLEEQEVDGEKKLVCVPKAE